MNILLTGSLAFDRIMDFPGYFKEHILPDQIHQLNVSFNIERLEEKRGGTAGNIAYTLALLGEKPSIVAAAGKDFSSYSDYLQQIGLPTNCIEVHDDILTATAYIITDRDDNQINGFFMGAMARPTTLSLDAYAPEDTIVLLSPGNKEDMRRYAHECRQKGIRYIFDPGQTLPFLTEEEIAEILNGAYILITNDYELAMIKKRLQLSQEDILQQVQISITTYGKEGSQIQTQEEVIRIPVCPPSAVVDPTGAGDAYRAGLIKGLLVSDDWRKRGLLASTAASYAIEQYGTQEQQYSAEDFYLRYEETFSEPCPLRS